MSFYDLNKDDRVILVQKIDDATLDDFRAGTSGNMLLYFSDKDTYIRKAVYLAVGKIYRQYPELLGTIIKALNGLYKYDNFSVRQTVVNAAGEIGKTDFTSVRHFFDTALFDEHHTVRNAVIGSVKKMGQVNPEPVLAWAAQYLGHPDKEIRREICHGIELRGRTHPEDILPLLQRLEFDKTARVRNTLVHVLGQVAYKKGCLEKVVAHLHGWQNKELVDKALLEIVDVHYRYRNFSYYTQKQALDYIIGHYNPADYIFNINALKTMVK